MLIIPFPSHSKSNHQGLLTPSLNYYTSLYLHSRTEFTLVKTDLTFIFHFIQIQKDPITWNILLHKISHSTFSYKENVKEHVRQNLINKKKIGDYLIEEKNMIFMPKC